MDDGETLLTKLKHGENNEFPDVIFLGISMRHLSGKSALQIIRTDHRYDNVYVVMQTVLHQEKNECLALGVSAFISK